MSTNRLESAIRFDNPSWVVERSTDHELMWINSATGDVLSLDVIHEMKKPPTIPSTESLRQHFREMAEAQKGGLIEVHRVDCRFSD